MAKRWLGRILDPLHSYFLGLDEVGEEGFSIAEIIRANRREKAEKALDVLCGEVLVGMQLIAKKREADQLVELTCVITSVDGREEPPENRTSRSISRYGEMPGEVVENLVSETIEACGIPLGRIIPVTERYIDMHKKLVYLRERIRGGVE